MKIKILRQQGPDGAPYFEYFDYDGPENNTVAGIIDYLNYNDDIRNSEGKITTRISWECSCLQSVCGACAMVINGVPRLACETFIKDLTGDVIEIRPLTKFPVVSDLVVDRTSIQTNLMKSDMFIGEYNPDTKADFRHQYDAAKCLKCGLCLEVCPNYTNGKNFYGALFANDCYLVASRNSDKKDDIRRSYREHFGKTCSKSLSCMDVCPMNIPTLASMAKMNRR